MPLVAANMALPAVKTLNDCADFYKTVEPLLPQLQALPQQVLDNITDLDALKTIYLSTSPLVTGFALSLALAPIFLVVSEINRNYSQVDRMWSLLPTIHVANYTLWAHLSGVPTQLIDNVFAFSCLWSIRLTFNYWRRGGYSIGSEDYRWEVIKKYVHPVIFFLFNVTFISTIQSVLLFLVTTPAYVLLLSSSLTGQGMALPDLIFSRVLIGLVVLEWFADQQQWNYQNAKHAYLRTGTLPPNSPYTRADFGRGFNTHGLWSISRHPNFLAEQAIWVLLYQWGCFHTQTVYNWSGLGALSYLMLFQGSTWLTELLTAGKYDEYPVYQEQVGRFFPKISVLWNGGYKPPTKEEKDKKSK
ncbi:hypothetical protein JOL62DRAFT_562212 [Phyllosticta paracitricarpa]